MWLVWSWPVLLKDAKPSLSMQEIGASKDLLNISVFHLTRITICCNGAAVFWCWKVLVPALIGLTLCDLERWLLWPWCVVLCAHIHVCAGGSVCPCACTCRMRTLGTSPRNLPVSPAPQHCDYKHGPLPLASVFKSVCPNDGIQLFFFFCDSTANILSSGRLSRPWAL